MPKCWVVTILECDHPNILEESPYGCCNCEMMNWLPAFNTEEECNEAFRKQYPEKFIEK